MKTILHDNGTYILRFDRGEDVIEKLRRFCEEENIQAGSLTAIGAVQEIELAFYDVDTQEYLSTTFTEKLEIASVVGNVSRLESDIVIHAHGVFSDAKMDTHAGHINRMIVAATCEVVLRKLGGVIERAHSDEIGLNLMN